MPSAPDPLTVLIYAATWGAVIGLTALGCVTLYLLGLFMEWLTYGDRFGIGPEYEPVPEPAQHVQIIGPVRPSLYDQENPNP